MTNIKYVPAIERQNESCDDCICNDSEGYYVQCWADQPSRGKQTKIVGHTYHREKQSSCKYHMTTEQYIALMDSLEEEFVNETNAN